MRKSTPIASKTAAAIAGLLLLAGTQRGLAQVNASSQTVIASSFGNASGLAVDSLGNLYVDDSANGLLASLQGSNAAPSTVLSGLSSPAQVAIDTAGNAYIANGTSNQVVKIPIQSGALNVAAATNLGTNLGTVSGVAVDVNNNVYIVDATNRQVVKISGTTQTVLSTALIAPKQIAVDRAGNVYIADAGANKVVRLPVGGGAATTVGTGLNAPAGVATDAANDVYIADTGNGRVLEIPYVGGAPSATQTVLTTAVTAPSSLALDSRGSVYIASGSTVYRYTFGAIYFGLLPVGSASQTFPVTLSFASTYAPATIKVLTTGITGLDYKDAGNDTCIAGTYVAGNTCVINVTFTPGAVGPRYGAVVLYDVNNKVLARVFLGGGGLGALLTVDPGTLTTITPAVSSGAATISNPHGLTTDAAGNIFVGDYTNNRIVEITAGQANSATPSASVLFASNNGDIAINGAGDILVANNAAYVFLYPYENGTWSAADVVNISTTNSKARVVRTDVGGNVFWCDSSNNAIYEAQIGGTPVKLPTSSYSTACLGVAVDLYGNIAAADSSTGKVLYVPVNGTTPYETGTLSGAWGVSFDASGSVWVTGTGASTLGRIPNENGTLVGADQTASTVGAAKDYGLWVDSGSGTLYTTQDSTTAAFSVINRLSTTHAFPTATAIGATTASTPFILSNSGDLPPIFTNGGSIALYDTFDFPAVTATSPACNFSLTLTPGFTCNLAYDFAPQSSGPRTETIEITSSASANAVINLSGTTNSTVSGSATVALALTTPSSGSPSPGQPLVVTAAVTPSASTPATGALTFSIDGTPTGSSPVASNGATFAIPGGLALGKHTIAATYSGDKNYAPITTAVSLSFNVVAATSTVSLVASGTDVAAGQSVALSSTVPTVTGLKTPTGTVTFKDTTTNVTLGTGNLNSNGIATLSTSFTAIGANVVQAVYSGDSVYSGSASSPVTVTVGAYASTATTIAVTPAQPAGGYTFGTVLNVAVAVAPQSGTGTPSGNIDFLLDGSPISVGNALTGGKVSVALSSIAAGPHTLVAYYSGDNTYATSASQSFSFSVIRASTATLLSISSTANYASVAVTLTATVSNVNVPSATPSGNVVFYSGKASLGTVALTGSKATLTTTLLPAGTDSITAVYQGDSNDIASTSAVMTDVVTIVPTSLTLTAAPSVLVSGGTTTLTATVVGSPITGSFGGTVAFSSGGSVIATSNISSSGIATYTTAALTAPVTSYTATYSGNAVYAQSSTVAAISVYLTNPSGAGVVATTSLGSGLSSAAGAAVDISGNLYIADKTKGLVALVAGGAGAQTTVTSGLTTPAGLATDGSGDLFIANGTAGHVTEIPSANNALSVSSAKQLGTGLGTVTGVAVDASGNVYAADGTNKQLVKIASSGTQTVLSSTLTNPQQVAVDALGDVFVADGTGNRVVYIPAGGTATTLGTGLLDPTGVAVDIYNNVYIADTGNNRVLKLAYTAGTGLGAQAVLIPSVTAPGQLAVDRHLALYIGQSNTIFKWQADAASFGVLTPGLTSPVYSLTFTFATAVTPSAINVLTSGVAGGEYAQAAGSTCVAGKAYAANQTCTVNVSFTPVVAGIRPGAVTFTAATGQPLVTAYLGGVLYAAAFNFDNPANQLNKGTQVTPTSTTSGSVVAGSSLSTLRGIAIDANSNLYLCDSTNNRIVQTNLTGTTSSVLYTGTTCGSVAIDGAGNLIVDDMGNNRMLLLPNENGTINGNDAYVAASGFTGPRGMSLDGFGNIYVANTSAATPNVVVAPIGGAAATQSVPAFSTLKSPYDVAVDWQGNIAVADSTLGQVAYLPATGSGPTTVGPPLCGPYAIAVDGGGGIYVTEISENCTTGTVTTGEDVVRIVPGSTFYDVLDSHASNAEGISLDQAGNVYTVYGGNIVALNRTSLPLAFASTVGVASAPESVTLTNSGPAPAVFTNATGIFYLDSLDFAVTSAMTSPCNFGASLAGGGDCEFNLVFNPVQSGTRVADFTPAANQVSQSYVALTGTAAAGTVTTTATTLSLAITSPPNGKPFPNTAYTITTTLSGGSGTPTGSITLSIDGVFVGQQSAAATLNFVFAAGLSPGFHTAVATYSGDTKNTSSTATLLISSAGSTPSSTVLTVSPTTVGVVLPSNSASCSLNTGGAFTTCTPITFTAVVAGTAGGATPTSQVLFEDGTTVLGIATVNAAGVATFVYTGALQQGTHNLMAQYSGNLTYASSSSAVVVLNAVYPGDYTLSLNPSTTTIAAGQTASITVTATPVPGLATGFYNGQIGLTCSGLPLYATCTVSPNSLNLDGTGTPVSGMINIITEAGFSQNVSPFSSSFIRLCMMPAASILLLFSAGAMRRRKLLRSALTRSLLCLLALAGLLSSLTACGSHAALAPAPGTYTVTISGAGAGGINHSMTMQVTIQK